MQLDLHGDGQLPGELEREAAAADVAALGAADMDSDDDEAAAAALRAKYGLGAAPKQEGAALGSGKSSGSAAHEAEQASPAGPAPGGFSWDDPAAVQRLTQDNAELKARIKEQARSIASLEEALLAVTPAPGLEPGEKLPRSPSELCAYGTAQCLIYVVKRTALVVTCPCLRLPGRPTALCKCQRLPHYAGVAAPGRAAAATTAASAHRAARTLFPGKFLGGGDESKEADGVDVDPRDVKIKELAKRTRKLNLTLQKEKDAKARAEADVQRLVAELEEATKARSAASSAGPTRSPGKTSAKVRALQERLVAAHSQLEANKASLALAHKALAAEVGPDVPVADVLEAVSQGASAAAAGTTGLAGGSKHTASGAAGKGWRGRSQRILLLKNKVKKLQSALEAARKEGPTADAGSEDGQDTPAEASEGAAHAKSRRSRTLEFLASENEELRQELEAVQKRAEAARARLRVVDMERKKATANITTLLSKTDNDDKLISALRSEVGHLERKVAEAQRAAADGRSGGSTLHLGSQPSFAAATTVAGPPSPGTDAGQHAHAEAQRLSAIARDQGRRLETQDRVIATLQAEVAALRNAQQQAGGGAAPAPTPAPGGMVGASRPSSSDIRHVRGMEVASAEAVARSRLLTMQVSQLQESLKAVSHRATQAEGTLQSYMARSAQLEARCRELEGAGAQVGSPSDPPALQAALATLQNQAQATHMHHASAIAARDAEAAQLRQALAAVSSAWDTFARDLREKAAAAGVALPPPQLAAPAVAAGTSQGAPPPPGGQLQPLPMGPTGHAPPRQQARPEPGAAEQPKAERRVRSNPRVSPIAQAGGGARHSRR